jgi:glycogen operon protein
MRVCLLDGTDETRYSLPEQTLGIWHGEVPGVGAGQRYGFRADGPYDPPAGRRFNPDRLLTDPYARALSGRFDSTGPVLDVTPGPSGQDSASCVPHSVVVEDDFDWGGAGATPSCTRRMCAG